MTVADAPDRAAEAGVAALETRAVRVVLGDLPVLRGVSLSVPAGTRLGLVGPNGAGKSTLLRVVAGLLRPESGEVVIHGRALRDDPWHARRAVGVVGHLGMLHPDLTLRENLASFANLYGLNRPDQRADEALQAVGLQDRAHSQTRTLSRGMLQRLALARATLHNPSILLLDEPETGLDARAHEYLTAVFARGAGRRTAVIASHDLGFIRDTTDEVAFLRSGTVVGRVETAGLGAAELRERYAEALARPPAARSRQRALRHGVVSS